MQELRWTDCPRCGVKQCEGCSELSQFERVEAAYTYRDPLAEILIQAKDKLNISAQKLFFDVFFIPIKQILVPLIHQKRYTHVIFSPLRKERILFSSWHSHFLYEELFNSILKQKLLFSPPKILMPSFTHKRPKQATIPTERRQRPIKQSSPLFFHNQKPELTPDSRVLLLDDVLTTGQTALFCKESCDEMFTPCSWDFFALLRAPRSLGKNQVYK